MAYDFEESLSQRITYTSVTDVTSKVAISFWFKAESLPGAHQMHFIDKGKNDSGQNRNFSMYWTPGGGGQYGVSWDNPAGSYHEWSKTATLPTATWTHWYCEIDWTVNPDSPLLWFDNVSQTLTNTFGTNNADPLTTATQHLSIGGEHGTGGNYYDGLLAEIGIWSDNNSTLRLAALSKGYSPAFFPTNLTNYIPLIRGLQDIKTGATGTLANTPVVAAHPRIIYPTTAGKLSRTGSAGSPPPAAIPHYFATMGVGQ